MAVMDGWGQARSPPQSHPCVWQARHPLRETSPVISVQSALGVSVTVMIFVGQLISPGNENVRAPPLAVPGISDRACSQQSHEGSIKGPTLKLMRYCPSEFLNITKYEVAVPVHSSLETVAVHVPRGHSMSSLPVIVSFHSDKCCFFHDGSPLIIIVFFI
jgi:hypothetical protein